MPRAVERKECPLSMRLPEADIAIIDRAATLRGRSRTDFVRDAAVRAAEDVLMDTAPIRMTPAGFEAFMEALSGPARAAPEMLELFQRVAPWETGSSGRKRASRRRSPSVTPAPVRSDRSTARPDSLPAAGTACDRSELDRQGNWHGSTQTCLAAMCRSRISRRRSRSDRQCGRPGSRCVPRSNPSGSKPSPRRQSCSNRTSPEKAVIYKEQKGVRGFIRKWRAQRESNPCFRRERATS